MKGWEMINRVKQAIIDSGCCFLCHRCFRHSVGDNVIERSDIDHIKQWLRPAH